MAGKTLFLLPALLSLLSCAPLSAQQKEKKDEAGAFGATVGSRPWQLYVWRAKVLGPMRPWIIEEFHADSGAKAAGMEVGDVIYKMNGIPFGGSAQRVSKSLAQYPPGTLVLVEFERKGVRMATYVEFRR